MDKELLELYKKILNKPRYSDYDLKEEFEDMLLNYKEGTDLSKFPSYIQSNILVIERFLKTKNSRHRLIKMYDTYSD